MPKLFSIIYLIPKSKCTHIIHLTSVCKQHLTKLSKKMYMYVFLAFSLASNIHGSNHFTERHFKAINFAGPKEGQKLDGNIFKDLEVTSEISCQFECVKETRCLSYNFLSIQGKCQLSNSDRFVGHMNLTQDDGALYRGIQVKILKFKDLSRVREGVG